LSLRLNRSVSTNLVLSSMRTIAAGAAKAALGLPVIAPTE
jgi:hypothetical protein